MLKKSASEKRAESDRDADKANVCHFENILFEERANTV